MPNNQFRPVYKTKNIWELSGRIKNHKQNWPSLKFIGANPEMIIGSGYITEAIFEDVEN